MSRRVVSRRVVVIMEPVYIFMCLRDSCGVRVCARAHSFGCVRFACACPVFGCIWGCVPASRDSRSNAVVVPSHSSALV